jgi:aminoglycoside phosphotransferase (APT) family kinase protein
MNIAALTTYLTATNPPVITGPISLTRIGHGQSNLTYRLETAAGTYILRRPPFGPIPPRAHDVAREFRVLRALHGSTVPVPMPIHLCEDPGVIGAPFYIMAALDGDALRFDLPPAWQAATDGERRALGLAIVDTLAAMQRLDPVAIGLGDLGRVGGYIARQLRLWQTQLEHVRVRPTDELDRVTAWLTEHTPPDWTTPTLVHGDYKLDNAIVSLAPPARVLGIVDWEMATLGDPLADLGWLLAFWRESGDPPPVLPILPRVTEALGFPDRADLALRYADQVGRALPDLAFYVTLARWKLAIILEGHWSRHIRDTAGEFDFAYLESAGPRFWASILAGIAD